MPNYILMIFEGEKTEPLIFESLKQYYLKEQANTILYGIYGGEIYSLFHKLEKDEDLELFPLLKDNLRDKNPDLQSIDRSQVSEIYLFFDFDGHAPTATDDKLVSMLSMFDNETNNGKLYISYPMVEALKHLKNGVAFKEIIVNARGNIGYKKVVHENSDFHDLTAFDESKWRIAINAHCRKLGHLFTDNFEFLDEYKSQFDIFVQQQKKHLHEDKVAVLSAFPIFLADYYGYEKIKSMIGA